MPANKLHLQTSELWPPIASAALRVAFGIIWAVGAALTFSPDFAVHYVGYLHNAAQGQPAWSAWWFNLWIAMVTPHVPLFVWLTRIIESLLALALLVGFARKTVYVLGALFSLLVWSTAEGFGGPYTVGATNMGAAITYVLIFIALIGINARGGRSPYSVDYFIEKRWPGWRRVAEWGGTRVLAQEPVVLPWRMQVPAVLGVVLLLVLLILGLESAFHVRSPSPVAAAAAVTPLSLASAKPTSPARDARLPPLIGTGNSVDVHLVASDHSVTIANGVDYQAWTFGGTVPGPILHVRQGQTVNVTFTNHGMMKHSLDFHAAVTPPSAHYVDIDPGQTITYSFVANTPGAFLYHCGTPPVLLHIANGMYGALIVDPAKPLPAAAASYVLVQGEWYTQQVSGKLMGANFEKMSEERPDEVVFNGTAFQYREQPLPATAGERIRLYVVNAGPNLWSSFHVIGAIFSDVYPDGDPAHAQTGVSTYTIGPGAGAIFDLLLSEAGHYPFVDHDMAHAGKGAIGVLDVRSTNGLPAPKPQITSAPAPAAPAATTAAAPSASAGPYKFDAAKGTALFTERCAACHQATGMGMPGAFPPLKGNVAVLDPNPAKQIDTILHGLQGQDVGGTVYATPMPPFGSLLNDAEIANIVNHERTSWGNQAKQVTPDDVKARRAAGAGSKP
ncbi:MAG TPA: multicopper oxidase domain-containing protein [Rhodanobacteraceae bacterium]|nr:multicopper oxidase domain-containing protein [Rhodanobacteraceae bacterium]